jgi:membrane-bound serine protease (ClpP class)
VYVHKDTGRALSAGVYILLSADTAAAQPASIIGAATPITGGGENANEKILNASAEWLGVLASRNDRTVEEIKNFVFEATTMTATEAADKGIIDIIATSTDGVVAALGYEVATLTPVPPRWSDDILSFLSLPFLVPLLLSLGGLGIFFMFRTGDIESVGLLGIVFLFLGLWGTGAITISTLGLLLLVTGLGLLAVEFLFSPGFGIAGGVGIVALILSTLTFANEPLYPSYFSSQIFYSVLGVWVGLGIIMVWLGRLSVATMLQPVQVGREAWYGKQIVLTSDLVPTGRMSIEADSYLARTIDGSTIRAGETVEIVKIEGNTILVALVTK